MNDVPEFLPPGAADQIDFIDVAFVSADTVWVLGHDFLLRSNDMGKTWHLKRLPNLAAYITKMFFLDQKCGWIVGSAGTIIKTADGGETFTVHQLENTWQIFDVYFTTSKLGWLAGEAGLLMKSVDGGISWAKIETDLHEDIQHLAMFSPQHGIATVLNGPALRTVDGITWKHIYLYEDEEKKRKEKKQDESKYPLPISTTIIDDHRGVLVGSYGLIALTIDAGKNWRIVRGQRQHNDALFEQYRHSRFARGLLDIEMGYVHPVGSIADRFGPGFHFSTSFLFALGLVKIGGGAAFSLNAGNEEMYAPVGTIEEDEAVKMGTNGIVIEMPLIVDLTLLERRGIQLRFVVSAAPRWEGTDIQDPWHDKVSYEKYNRSRWGLGLQQ